MHSQNPFFLKKVTMSARDIQVIDGHRFGDTRGYWHMPNCDWLPLARDDLRPDMVMV